MTATKDRARALVVGDGVGVPQTLRVLPPDALVGIVAASNRPQYHEQLRRIAARRSVPLLVQPAWRSAGYANFIAAAARLRPTIAISNCYSMLLRPEFLRLAPMGGINVHTGRVPEYRGPNPIQWQIINDERVAGITIHEMSEAIDAGPVIAETTVSIRFDERWSSVAERAAAAAEILLERSLPALLAGTAPRRAQDERAARTWPRRKPEHGRIDWSWSVLRIHNLVRALGAGIPPAFYEHEGVLVQLDSYLSPAEVTALKYAPGPGGRRLEAAGLELAPDPNAGFVRFRVRRSGRETGECGLHDFDPDRRAARAWARPHDASVLHLLRWFAREELGLSIQESA